MKCYTNWRRFGGAPWRYLPFHPFGKALLEFQQHLALCVELYRIDPEAEGVGRLQARAHTLCMRKDLHLFYRYLNPANCASGHITRHNVVVLKRTEYHTLTWVDLVQHLGGSRLLKEVDLVNFGSTEAVLSAHDTRVATIEFSEARAEEIVEILNFLTGLHYDSTQFPGTHLAVVRKDEWRWEVEKYHLL